MEKETDIIVLEIRSGPYEKPASQHPKHEILNNIVVSNFFRLPVYVPEPVVVYAQRFR